jgi:nitric oxide reductase
MIEDLVTKEKIDELKPKIQKVVDEVLDAIIKKGTIDGPIDLVEEYATLIPTRIVYGILGVPDEDILELSKASAIRVSTSGTANDAGDEFLHSYMTKLVDKRISKPGDPKNDLVSKLVIEQYKPGKIGGDDIQSLAYLVLVAGNAAVINSITLGVLSLLQHPEQLEELKKDPKLTSAVTEEVLRYHTPSSLNCRRVAIADIHIGGKVRLQLLLLS